MHIFIPIEVLTYYLLRFERSFFLWNYYIMCTPTTTPQYINDHINLLEKQAARDDICRLQQEDFPFKTEYNAFMESIHGTPVYNSLRCNESLRSQNFTCFFPIL